LNDTPAHLLWDGYAAVLVFFVLSGLVLSSTHLGRGPRVAVDWVRYYPRRFVRLYVPVWGALLLTFLLGIVFRWTATDGALSFETLDWTIILRSFASDATLLGRAGAVIAPLWSLKWEVLFSALLPLFVLAARRTRHIRAVLLVAVLVALRLVGVAGFPGSDLLIYLPVFGFGVLMAARSEGLERVAHRLEAWHWIVLTAATLVIAGHVWIISGVPALSEFMHLRRFTFLSTALSGIGASMIVLLAWRCTPITRVLETSIIQWTGDRSYSLFLIHMPVIFVVATTVGDSSPAFVPACIVATLVVATVFQRLVANPSVILSRRIGGVRS
jgi:peptidoglycan/LPS O-acetylase OafA/YrhL